MKPAPPKYTEAEQLAALELAVAIGRNQAIKQLGISSQTFQRWTQKHAKFYSDLQANDPEAQRKGFARNLEDLAQEGMALEHDAIARAHTLLPKADAKETAALLKATAASRQAAVIGSRQVLGEPEVHEHNINFPQIEAAMERLLAQGAPQPALVVENEAETADV